MAIHRPGREPSPDHVGPLLLTFQPLEINFCVEPPPLYPRICRIWLQQPEQTETPSLPQICQSRICMLRRAPGASLRNPAVETTSPPLYYTNGETVTNPGFSLRDLPTIPHAEQMVWGECEPRCPVAQASNTGGQKSYWSEGPPQ